MVALCNDDVTDPATDVDMLGFKLDETEPVVEPVAGPVTEPLLNLWLILMLINLVVMSCHMGLDIRRRVFD